MTVSFNSKIEEIARANQTPFFVIFENILQDNYAFLKQCFSGVPKIKIYYSLKTNYESFLLRALRKLGAEAAVCGGLDLALAEKAGFIDGNIIFDGCFKSDTEIADALARDIRLFNVESLQEIDTIDRIAGTLHKKARIGVRIDYVPFSAHPLTVIMKHFQKRFGVSPRAAVNAARYAHGKNNIEVRGLMVHSNNLYKSGEDYAKMLKKLFRLSLALRKEGIPIEEINLGGGFPRCDQKHSLKRTAGKIIAAYRKLSAESGYYPELIIEPGIALVDNAVKLAGKIVRVEDGRAVCDLSINDLGYRFPVVKKNVIVLRQKGEGNARVKVDVYGPTVNPYDRICAFEKLPALEQGDMLVIVNAGAYTISCSTQFIRPRQAVYFVTAEGKTILARPPESYEDVSRAQVWDSDA